MTLLVVLSALVAVLHGAHLTGLRNTLAALVAAWVVLLLAGRGRRPPLLLPLFAWFALASLSFLWSADAEITVKSVLTDIMLPAGALYGAYLICQDARAFRAMAMAMTSGVAFLAALTLFAYVLGQIGALQTDESGGLLRYYPGPGVASTLVVYALPFAVLLASERDRIIHSMGYGLLACALVVGLGSLNRMFWLASVMVVAAFYAWQWPSLARWQRRVLVSGAVAGAAGAIAIVAYLTHARNADEISRDIRLQAWQEWAVVAAEAPLLGHGFGKKIVGQVGGGRLAPQVTERHPYLRAHGHNLFLVVLLQLGLAGLAVYSALLAALAREAWRGRRGNRLPESGALAALLVGMVAKNFTDDFMDHAVVIAFWGYAGMLLGRLSARANG